MTESTVVRVAVGVIENSKGEILIARRRAGQHLAGLWEFPGGKLENKERPEAALHRELKEELGIEPSAAAFQFVIDHRYAEKQVSLFIFHVTAFLGEARGQEGQELRWVNRDELAAYRFPEANQKILCFLNVKV